LIGTLKAAAILAMFLSAGFRSPRSMPPTRPVAIDEDLAPVLGAWIKSRRVGPNDELFPFSGTMIQSVFERIWKAAGIEKFTPHNLRNTWGVTASRQGIDWNAIREQLGHSSLATTMRYIKVGTNSADRAWWLSALQRRCALGRPWWA
jgi:integrase